MWLLAMRAATPPLAATFCLLVYSSDFEIRIKLFMSYFVANFNIPGSTFSKIKATGHVNGLKIPSYACIS